MKKMIILIVSLVSISIILFVIFTGASNTKLTESEALKIGEEKYLEFLWMVDGAFNNERLAGEYIVNNKKLDDTSKVFTCTYKNKNDLTCLGENFEEEFRKLFVSSIDYDKVYGDSTLYSWMKYEDGKYFFTSLKSCNVIRMSLNQSIEVKEISSDKLEFNVSFENSDSNIKKNRVFVLSNENSLWKVSKAYYHDLCEMDYNII